MSKYGKAIVMELVDRGACYVCGWAVETTAEGNDRDIAVLYDDFFGSGKESLLRDLPGSQPGYFGLSWYTQEHSRYCYLLGMEVGPDAVPPTGASVKKLAPTRFAVGSYPASKSIIEAWNEFFYADIPHEGLAPNEPYNLYFEYYPGDVHGDYQLWVPVVPAKQTEVEAR